MLKKLFKTTALIFVLLIVFAGGFAWGLFRSVKLMMFATDPDGKQMPLRLCTLIGNLSNMRDGKADDARTIMERDLAVQVDSMCRNSLWPEAGRPERDKALGFAKLYFTAFPLEDKKLAGIIDQDLVHVGVPKVRPGDCWPSLRRLLPPDPSASAPAKPNP